jgi:ankyrin repeat protein
MRATQNGHYAIVALLVKAGADLNATDSKGSTALVYAAKSGQNEILQFLLSCPWSTAGCSLDITAAEALVVAAKEGHLDVLETLINCGNVDVNQPCGLSGEVALCTAASCGQLGSCQILIKGKTHADVFM